MSKAALCKELALMTPGQLTEVILEAYDSRREIRDYFEYFLNPQPLKLIEKAGENIAKELNRSSRGHSKARITRIRAEIKKVADYRPGAEYVIKVIADTLRMLAGAESWYRFPPTLYNGTARIISDLMAYAQNHECLGDAIKAVDELIASGHGRNAFHNFIRNSAEEALAAIAAKGR